MISATPRLHVVLRTCDRVSLSSDRIVDKPTCVITCLRSLVTSLENQKILPWSLRIFDDDSSANTQQTIRDIAHMADITYLEPRPLVTGDVRLQSRFSVAMAYQYIYDLPQQDLVYVIEDDYLHYPNSIEIMIRAWQFFSEWLMPQRIGIFPQDFQQLHASPHHPYNDTYVRACTTYIGPDRYYRSTWYTQESFLLLARVFHDYRTYFDQLLTIGQDPATWEGNTISQIWQQPDICMLMPMPTIAIHVSQARDIPFYCNDFAGLWHANSGV